jgi:predicted metal-dependent peptidase
MSGRHVDSIETVPRQPVEEALSTMSDQEIGQVDQRTINAVADIVAGTEAGSAIERIEQIRYRRTDVPWRRLFRESIRQGAEPQPTFMRPPRRFPAMLGLVPGRFHRPNRASVMAIVDTSSSVGPRDLALISSELEVIAATNDVLVVECDAAVRRVYPFTSSLTEVRGRGGTDFRPPLKESFLAKHRPGLLVFFTDGHGPAPLHQPRVPVLWCLTATGVRPAPWGREIRLPR